MPTRRTKHSFALLLAALLLAPALSAQSPSPNADVVSLHLPALQQRADAGDPAAQVELGRRYQDGDGVSESMAVAINWYRRAADQGSPGAQSRLGSAYMTGQGVAKDLPQAAIWFRMAAEHNDLGAQFNLGYMYGRGEGVTQDFAQALFWYRKAADQGEAAAQAVMGTYYEKGNGVEVDTELAKGWFAKAALQGNEYARSELTKLDALPSTTSQRTAVPSSVSEHSTSSVPVNVTRTAESNASLSTGVQSMSDTKLRHSIEEHGVPLLPLPPISKELSNQMAKEGRVVHDAGPLTYDFEKSLAACEMAPGGVLPTESIAFSCVSLAMQFAYFLNHDARYFKSWGANHGYIGQVQKLMDASRMRGCSLGDPSGCDDYGRTLAALMYINSARYIWSSGPCLKSPRCSSDLADSFLTPEQLKQREQELTYAGAAEYRSSHPQKTNNTLAMLGAINEGLGAGNDQLAQANAQQAADNDARMQQAQAQVAANDARRAQQAEDHRAAVAQQAAAREAAARHAESQTASNNITVAPHPAPPPSNTVAPPVPYQPPPSTGGTVVASGTVCPASGYIFTSYGDAATGVPCTPGQPIKPASGSNGSTQTPSAGSGIKTTPVLTNCLAQRYVDGDLTVTNTCNVPVYATWWVNGHSGSWTLNPSEHTGTGYHSSDVVAGGASYYVCPKNASPADSTGHNLTGPVSTYVCVVRY